MRWLDWTHVIGHCSVELGQKLSPLVRIHVKLCLSYSTTTERAEDQKARHGMYLRDHSALWTTGNERRTKVLSASNSIQRLRVLDCIEILLLVSFPFPDQCHNATLCYPLPRSPSRTRRPYLSSAHCQHPKSPESYLHHQLLCSDPILL